MSTRICEICSDPYDEELGHTCMDVVSWLREEMKKELNKVLLVEVYGPALYGEGNFDLHQNAGGSWFILPKERDG